MFQFVIDTTIRAPYSGMTLDIDGEQVHLLICNPVQSARLPFWLREHLLNLVSATLCGGDPGDRTDNVIYLDRYVDHSKAASAGTAATRHMIATDR